MAEEFLFSFYKISRGLVADRPRSEPDGPSSGLAVLTHATKDLVFLGNQDPVTAVIPKLCVLEEAMFHSQRLTGPLRLRGQN